MSEGPQHVFVGCWRDNSRERDENRWVAEVEDPDLETLYTSTWYATEAEALADAERWVKANGHTKIEEDA